MLSCQWRPSIRSSRKRTGLGKVSGDVLRLESATMKKALAHLKNSDIILASIIERVGPCRISYRDPTFEALARSIVFQQLSTKAARTIYGRFEEAAGGLVTPET